MSRKPWLVCLLVAATMLSRAAPAPAGSLQQVQSSSSAQQDTSTQTGTTQGDTKPDAAKQDAAKQQLPAGPGRDTLVRVCSGCHLLTVVTTQRKTESAWTDTVIEMRNRGANASDDDLEAIVEYLAKNFGPQSAPVRININTASASEIAAALSLPQPEAEAIVDYRNKNGKFKDIDGVKQVPGIAPATIDSVKDRIDF